VKAAEVERAKELVRDQASRDQCHQLELRTLDAAGDRKTKTVSERLTASPPDPDARSPPTTRLTAVSRLRLSEWRLASSASISVGGRVTTSRPLVT
jgi:hypothetical protein